MFVNRCQGSLSQQRPANSLSIPYPTSWKCSGLSSVWGHLQLSGLHLDFRPFFICSFHHKWAKGSPQVNAARRCKMSQDVNFIQFHLVKQTGWWNQLHLEDRLCFRRGSAGVFRSGVPTKYRIYKAGLCSLYLNNSADMACVFNIYSCGAFDNDVNPLRC